MMKVSFEGIGESVATFYNSGAAGANAGNLVKISGNGEICACSDNDRIAGFAISADKDFAAVQIGGFVTLPYTGADPVPGFVKLSASSSVAVKKDDVNGSEFLVIETNTSAKTVGFIL